jgi:hypothetical protein
LKTRKKYILAIAGLVSAAIILTVLTQALLVAQQSVSTNGNVGVVSSVNIGVYSNAAATTNCTSINWGTVTPGTSVNQTVYIKNLGNTAETLSLTTSSWNPASATSYLTLTWTEQGYVLPAGSVIAATLTLTAASSAASLTSFSFNIVISGTA